ncbi:MAG: hypothetical protein AVDCRST_MAG18-139 [uncultured Thermomicrobiales bacterium]|uniref:Resolvase/invertase-type recombinase catalytic domain-containing protein n=1 Tax=uncultured Thermomicrobiales bacterium TaxID=1645740 RepID=A0A6J4UIK1_9BACT|nr:MAG: hypothetical protein AVDCRST_MAG18-139 [uncultured Thermomicrobiales bacterium]
MSDEQARRVGAGKTVLLYVRESQYNERERTSVEEQLAAGRALANRLGYGVSEELTVIERGPNSSLTRAGITALIGHVAAGRAGAIITHTLDRLGRPDSEALEALLRELRRRAIPIYVARTPGGYSYDPQTGDIVRDSEAIHAATLREWQPPEFIIIPRENEQDERFAEQFPRLNQAGELPANGRATDG